MTSTRWADEIDRSFGSGPTPPPTATYVASGRAAVRRRRIAAGAVSSFAAVVMIGGIGWAVMPGDARPDASQVATDPTPTAAGTPSPSPEEPPLVESSAEVRAARPDEMAMLGRQGLAVAPVGDGTLVRRPGWTVRRLVVLEDLERHKAWGVELDRDGGTAEQWALATWSSNGSTSVSFEEPGKRFAVFDDWIRDKWADEQRWADTSTGAEAPPPLVARVVDGEVVADDSVVLLEAVMAPTQAAAYGPVDQQAAVRLSLADGSVWFARVDSSGATTVDPAVLDAPTMAAFLRHLEAQGDSGEGLR